MEMKNLHGLGQKLEMCPDPSHLEISKFNKMQILWHLYSRACLIHMANAWKNCANYLSMQIIRAYFMLCFYQCQRVVSMASVWIKQGMQISKGQIIQAIL